MTEEIKAKPEVLYEGGPTVKQVEAWKAEHNGNIFMTEIDDQNIFIWRPITRKEYKAIVKNQNADAMYREERICEMCIVWPQDYDVNMSSNGMAGIPSLIAEQIMDKSGFIPAKDVKRL